MGQVQRVVDGGLRRNDGLSSWIKRWLWAMAWSSTCRAPLLPRCATSLQRQGWGGGNPTKFLVGDPVEAAMGVVASSEWVEDDGAWMAARVTLDRLRTVVEVPSDRLRRAAELLRRVDKSCGWISHRMDCSDAESSHNAGCGVSTRGRLGGGEAILSVSMFFFFRI